MMKKLRTIFISITLTALFILGASLNAQAISWGLTGSITDYTAGNPWGIDNNSSLTGTAYWDETLLLGSGDEALSDFDDPTMNLEVSIGSFAYSFVEDIAALGSPFLGFGFSDGLLRNISLFGGAGDLGTFGELEIFFDFPDDVNVFAITNWNEAAFATGEMAPVPEPGTFLLLGAGLSGLFYVQRRRKVA